MRYSRKHILNKHLKAKVNHGGIKLYPVYIQVIYKRKNYWFKSVITTYYTDLNFVNEKDRQIMKVELELLDAILENEFATAGEKFELAGFANKFNYYRLPVSEQGERLLIGKLESLLSKSYKEFIGVMNYEYLPGKFEALLRATLLLYPEIKEDITFRKLLMAQKFWNVYKKTFPETGVGDFKRPSVFDWISGEHLSAMKKILEYNLGEVDENDFELLEDFDKNIKQVTVGT